MISLIQKINQIIEKQLSGAGLATDDKEKADK